jgi:hypothetical protein
VKRREKMGCSHRKRRKHFPFGRRSGARFYCKTCGLALKKCDFRKERKRKVIRT